MINKFRRRFIFISRLTIRNSSNLNTDINFNIITSTRLRGLKNTVTSQNHHHGGRVRRPIKMNSLGNTTGKRVPNQFRLTRHRTVKGVRGLLLSKQISRKRNNMNFRPRVRKRRLQPRKLKLLYSPGKYNVSGTRINIIRKVFRRPRTTAIPEFMRLKGRTINKIVHFEGFQRKRP